MTSSGVSVCRTRTPPGRWRPRMRPGAHAPLTAVSLSLSASLSLILAGANETSARCRQGPVSKQPTVERVSRPARLPPYATNPVCRAGGAEISATPCTPSHTWCRLPKLHTVARRSASCRRIGSRNRSARGPHRHPSRRRAQHVVERVAERRDLGRRLARSGPLGVVRTGRMCDWSVGSQPTFTPRGSLSPVFSASTKVRFPLGTPYLREAPPRTALKSSPGHVAPSASVRPAA